MADEFINEALDWDSEIENDGNGEFVILPEGDYTFTVKDFKRGNHPGSAKIPPCGKAELTLEIKTDNGTALVFENLLLCNSLEWKLAAFFRSIGQKKRGEKMRPDWNKVLGSTGKAHIKPDTYIKDGNERKKNVVDKFIDADGSAKPNASALNVNVADGADDEVPFG